MRVGIGDLTPRVPMGLQGLGDNTTVGPFQPGTQQYNDYSETLASAKDQIADQDPDTIANQQAGIAYRDSLLSDSAQQQQFLTWGLFGAGALIVLMMATSGSSGGRRR